MGRRNAREARAHPLGRLLHARSRGHEDRHAPLAAREFLQEPVVEELEWLLALHFDLGRLGRIERGDLQHFCALEIARVEGRIDRGGEPDVATSHALAEREAEFELGAGLVDLVHDQGVGGQNVAILEPAAGDAGGDDDDVPARSLGRGLPLAIDHAHAKVGGAEDRLRDGANGEGFSGAGAGDDAEAVATRGQPPQIDAAGALEKGVEVQADGEFDGLARGACGCDDDDAAGTRLGREVGLAVGRQKAIGGFSHALNLPRDALGLGRGRGRPSP